MKYLLIVLMMVITGCATMVKVKSNDNGLMQVKTNLSAVSRSGPVIYKSDIHLALAWDKSMGDQVILTASVKGGQSFVETNSLTITINGYSNKFSSIDNVTTVDLNIDYKGRSDPKSSNDYMVSKEFLSRLLSSNDATIKIQLRHGAVTGNFINDNKYSAQSVFKEFITMAEKHGY